MLLSKLRSEASALRMHAAAHACMQHHMGRASLIRSRAKRQLPPSAPRPRGRCRAAAGPTARPPRRASRARPPVAPPLLPPGGPPHPTGSSCWPPSRPCGGLGSWHTAPRRLCPGPHLLQQLRCLADGGAGQGQWVGDRARAQDTPSPRSPDGRGTSGTLRQDLARDIHPAALHLLASAGAGSIASWLGDGILVIRQVTCICYTHVEVQPGSVTILYTSCHCGTQQR